VSSDVTCHFRNFIDIDFSTGLKRNPSNGTVLYETLQMVLFCTEHFKWYRFVRNPSNGAVLHGTLQMVPFCTEPFKWYRFARNSSNGTVFHWTLQMVPFCTEPLKLYRFAQNPSDCIVLHGTLQVVPFCTEPFRLYRFARTCSNAASEVLHPLKACIERDSWLFCSNTKSSSCCPRAVFVFAYDCHCEPWLCRYTGLTGWSF
jgi:hypothetical protein